MTAAPSHETRISRAALERLWADESLSQLQLARRLGVSVHAVRRRARAFGLPSRRFRPVLPHEGNKDLFVRMWQANVRLEQMSRCFRCSPEAVSAMARRLGLTRHCHRYNSIGLAEFLEIELAARMALTAKKDRAAYVRRMGS